MAVSKQILFSHSTLMKVSYVNTDLTWIYICSDIQFWWGYHMGNTHITWGNSYATVPGITAKIKLIKDSHLKFTLLTPCDNRIIFLISKKFLTYFYNYMDLVCVNSHIMPSSYHLPSGTKKFHMFGEKKKAVWIGTST